MNQGKGTGPARSALVRPVSCRRHGPFPGPGRLSSSRRPLPGTRAFVVEWTPPSRELGVCCRVQVLFNQHHMQQEPGSRDRGLRTAVWTQGQSFQGTPAILGDGAPSRYLCPSLRKGTWGRNKPLHRQEHISKPHESGIF